LDTQQHAVVIPLVDAEFVGRASWRLWLDKLPSEPEKGAPVVLPWAFHPAAVQIDRVSRSQLLGSGPCDLAHFCRLATEACALSLLPESELQIFLSYARKDGRDIALEVRRVLQEYGHIRAFMDEQDIQPGEDWHDKLHTALGRGAAMVAIVTDAYASRPWCREELRTFREPRPHDTAGRWWLPPVFILDNLSGRATRSLFEVGSAPTARWDAARSHELIDQLVREVLIGAQQKLRTIQLAPSVLAPECVVNWIPDTWTLLSLKRQIGSLGKIIYPGDGLPEIELHRLRQVFQEAEFKSYEETLHDSFPSFPPQPKLRRVLAFSVSEPAEGELIARGVSKEHLDDVVFRVGRSVLRLGADIAYGGTAKVGFTAGFLQDSGTLVLEPRLINYLGWPWADRLTPAQIADDLGVCRYVKIEAPSTVEKEPVSSDAYRAAIASTYTRNAIATGSHHDVDGHPIGQRVGQVVFAGKLAGYAGVLPGVWEEAWIAHSAGLALFIVGGFGGAAGVLASFLSDARNSTPTGIDGAPCSNPLLQQARRDELARFWKCFDEIRTRQDLGNGLNWNENLQLMNTLDAALIVRLINTGLARFLAASGK